MGDDSEGGSTSVGRGLFTDREREILEGEAEVKDNYRYKVESLARSRVDLLERDLKVLEENYPELFKQIQEVVCDDES